MRFRQWPRYGDSDFFHFYFISLGVGTPALYSRRGWPIWFLP